eukprot:scaffold34603_cov212-Amphora_coffeaeformis.AAC.19
MANTRCGEEYRMIMVSYAVLDEADVAHSLRDSKRPSIDNNNNNKTLQKRGMVWCMAQGYNTLPSYVVVGVQYNMVWYHTIPVR